MFKSKWGQWIDISTGSLCSSKYVLQARRHKDGRIQMRVEIKKAYDTVAHPTIDQLKEISYRDNPRIDKNLLLKFFKAGNECACMEHENIEDYFEKYFKTINL